MPRVICKPRSIDAFGVRPDGGLDLVIVANGPLDGRAETRRLLVEKLSNYISVHKSEEAAASIGFDCKEPLRVILVLPERAAVGVHALLQQCREMVQSYGRSNSFEVQVCAV